MPQSKLVILGLIGIIAIGGAYVALKPKEGIAPTIDQTSDAPAPTATDASPEASGKKVPFSTFIAQGGSYKCTVNQSIQGTETKGITYVDSGMIRGEYKVQAQGMEIDSNMIMRDGYTYSWSSMMPNMGFKTKIDTNVNQTTNAPTTGTYSWNADQVGDYSCEAWNADPSFFEIPTTITFRSVN